MATHDYNIANQGFPAFRADLNDALLAIVSNNSNATAPATTFAHMLWVDTAANPSVLKIRNADNDAWITIGEIDQTGDKFNLTCANATIAENLTLNAQGDLRFADSDSSNWVAFQAPATVSSNVTWTLPSADGTNTQVLTTNGSGTLSWASPAPDNGYLRNRIINGGFDIAQRGTSFVSGANDDDTYNLDRWYVLSDGNDVVDITQTTTVPTGAKFSIGLDVETTNKKFGIAQIIENANCFDAIGKTVTLSFDARVSSTTKLDNVKCAIVAWSGTADSVTSDIISAWGAEGTNPTLIANATYENSPANLNVTTSFARYTVSAAVDTSNTTNIIVFIWSDVTDTTAGDFLYITNVQLEVGSVATPFERRPYGTELSLCQRYYAKLSNDGSGDAASVGVGGQQTTTSCWFYIKHPVTMRSEPTVAISSLHNTDFANYTTDATLTNTFAGYDASTIYCSMSANGAAYRAAGLIIKNNTAGFLALSSEL